MRRDSSFSLTIPRREAVNEATGLRRTGISNDQGVFSFEWIEWNRYWQPLLIRCNVTLAF